MDKTILVVDDDSELRALLSEYLGESGYRTLQAGDGTQMWEQFRQHRIDLVILDLMLPGDDGFALCRRLRERSSVPILMLTARSDQIDRILGLELGADDYVQKPFVPRELLVRIRNVLRRSGDAGGAAAHELRFAGMSLDLDAHHLVDAEGLVVALSSGEFRLLRALAENPRRVMSRDRLHFMVSGRDAGPDDRTIDVMIGRLRRKLRDDGGESGLIRTVRSEGYMLAEAVERRP